MQTLAMPPVGLLTWSDSTVAPLADDGVCVRRASHEHCRLVQIRAQKTAGRAAVPVRPAAARRIIIWRKRQRSRRQELRQASGRLAATRLSAAEAAAKGTNTSALAAAIKIWLRSDLAALDYMLFFAVFSSY